MHFDSSESLEAALSTLLGCKAGYSSLSDSVPMQSETVPLDLSKLFLPSCAGACELACVFDSEDRT